MLVSASVSHKDFSETNGQPDIQILTSCLLGEHSATNYWGSNDDMVEREYVGRLEKNKHIHVFMSEF